MPRGGKREGAGRKGSGKPVTKATIYLEDRTILNDYAKSLRIPVNELIHRIINDSEFKKFLEHLSE